MEKVVLNWSDFVKSLDNWVCTSIWINNKIYVVQKDYATEFYVLHVYLNSKDVIAYENDAWDYQVSIPSLVILRKYLIEIGVDFE